VGSEQPVIKTKVNTGVTVGVNTVIEPEYKKIGLEMEVTPFVASTNEVRLVIKIKDTAITGNVLLAGDRYPILANRELNTDLVTSDGRTVFLGGIRRQDATDTSTRIPGPGDLPVAGAAFRNKQMDSTGSELIILATATVMLDQQGADLVTGAVLRASSKSMPDLRPPKPTAANEPDTAATSLAVPGAVTSPAATGPAATAPAAANSAAPAPAAAPSAATAPAAADSTAAAPPAMPSAAAPPAAKAEAAAPAAAASPAKAEKRKASKPRRPAEAVPKSSASK
jgi:hypothetical protein